MVVPGTERAEYADAGPGKSTVTAGFPCFRFLPAMCRSSNFLGREVCLVFTAPLHGIHGTRVGANGKYSVDSARAAANLLLGVQRLDAPRLSKTLPAYLSHSVEPGQSMLLD